MADDQTNPFTLMGMMGMMSPNKYLNPANLTGYNGGLAMPGFYGDPTDAAGSDIQSFQDAKAAQPPAGTTTLTSVPSSGEFIPPSADYNMGRVNPDAFQNGVDPSTGQTIYQAQAALQNYYNPTQGSMIGGDTGGGTGGGYSHGPTPQYEGPSPQSMGVPAPWASQGASSQSSSPAAAAGRDMRQAYLDALSRPQGRGRMITPGADVPAASPKALLGQPSVLSAFMSQHPDGGTPAPAGGGYSNAPFFSTLNKLRSA